MGRPCLPSPGRNFLGRGFLCVSRSRAALESSRESHCQEQPRSFFIQWNCMVLSPAPHFYHLEISHIYTKEHWHIYVLFEGNSNNFFVLSKGLLTPQCCLAQKCLRNQSHWEPGHPGAQGQHRPEAWLFVTASFLGLGCSWRPGASTVLSSLFITRPLCAFSS